MSELKNNSYKYFATVIGSCFPIPNQFRKSLISYKVLEKYMGAVKICGKSWLS